MDKLNHTFLTLHAAALTSARNEQYTYDAARPEYGPEDAAQDAMIVLLEQLSAGRDDDAPVVPFVRRVAKNRIRTAGRTYARRNSLARAGWEKLQRTESDALAAERALAGAPAHLLRVARLTQAQNRAENADLSTYHADLIRSESRGLLRELAESRGYSDAPSVQAAPLMPRKSHAQDWQEPKPPKCTGVSAERAERIHAEWTEHLAEWKRHAR